jgi:hypothetical protein
VGDPCFGLLVGVDLLDQPRLVHTEYATPQVRMNNPQCPYFVFRKVEPNENSGTSWRCSRQGVDRAPTDQSGEQDLATIWLWHCIEHLFPVPLRGNGGERLGALAGAATFHPGDAVFGDDDLHERAGDGDGRGLSEKGNYAGDLLVRRRRREGDDALLAE